LGVQVPRVLRYQWDLDAALMYLCRQSYPFTDHAFSSQRTLTQSINFILFAARLRGNFLRTIPFIVQKIFLPGYELPYVPIPLLPIYFILKPYIWAKFQNNLGRHDPIKA
jgi:hypothetical protein